MRDAHGRQIDYIRLSVTDRCNLRCTYCMAEEMEFLPRRDLLTFEEIETLARHLVVRGVRRIRLTGGEPLVRKGVLELVERLARLRTHGLNELTLTTNGTRLPEMAQDLFDAGVRRINISLDTLRRDRFAELTRRDEFERVVSGIDAARDAGLAVRINAVAMRGTNDDEMRDLLAWCGARGLDLALIEAMPLGEVSVDRPAAHLPLDAVREELERHFTLVPSLHRTGGPARYFDVAETGTRIGLITPLSNNFCAGCNRIRISATGTVYGCLGHDQKVELRDIVRAGGEAALDEALERLLAGKPLRHAFDAAQSEPALARHMSVTGG
ncbi:GTP 3',8-cyclase MoaA [Qipengyuania citrea]|jgi:cyclic pyranopterin phosphate synthase|uniref:GTP 3',8-cyclase MoaA n=1 Tax=Qipengyuania citrea TaxID=225971 RepID=UPI000E80A1B8|nr:GTP 3',8-cyclase MoaA [Qipengyuania citrea]MCD1589778.1 GTP 3',8-cyclase MoaA [Qipengyuania citrea]MCZ4264618.1 GTP 3',8-cyclase MoaA [Erythrobacter sp. G21629-S1]HBK16047.1 GTP 3',8-cyclase MoaA [Erythrobacter sp.]HCJ45142.1 GTP 3',8-cyclase MoaA [Erythrobacter sp.]|tara:strand:- start:14 stop:991 length:978 start_codon:yes stop_codon:yes gene_type:complete